MRAARVAVLTSFCVLAGCGSYTQTTSGQAYLDNPATRSLIQHDARVESAAAVEPLLRFPARIGIARIDLGQLSAIPPAEAEEWQKLGQRLGSSFGEFVPVSPLIARMAEGETRESYVGRPYGQRVDEVIRSIRLGAARQHLDATLIYEVRSKDDNRLTPLSLLDLTIIGAWIVPSRAVEAKGFATALLVDVRNGYPYGFTDTVTDEQDTFRPTAGSDRAKAALADDAKAGAVKKLVPEVERMALKLRAELAERRLVTGN